MPSNDDSESRRHRHHRRRGRSAESDRFAKHAGGRDPDETATSAPLAGIPSFRPAAAPSMGESGSPSRDSAGSAAVPLAAFREQNKRLEIHPLELALLWVVCVHLVFLPWALGTVHVWAQVTSFAFSVLGLCLALWPRQYTAEQSGAPTFRMRMFPKLLRFPIFWLGVAMFVLILMQGLNPAWEYHSNGKNWWMQRIPHVTWLPTGIRGQFQRGREVVEGGQWRNLLVYGSAWMTVCALWVGFTRRRTLQRFFLVLAVNGVALAIFGLAQRVLGVPKIFGFYASSNPSFFASFIYKNHAGAYLVLMLVMTCALGAWYYVRGVRRLEKSSPAGVFAFFATCIAVSVLISGARGATLTALAYLCVVVAGFVIFQWRLPAVARSPVITVALLIVFGLFLKTGLDALHSEAAWSRLGQALSGDDLSVKNREYANQASFEMLGDNWKLGVGSGSYPYLFPKYQIHHPEIATRMFWPHAHNDVLEFPIELGVPGMLLIFASFASWGVVLVRNYAWENPLTASVILGCLFLIGMAWGEFVFQCPAILITWLAFWPAATKWAQLEEQRGRG